MMNFAQNTDFRVKRMAQAIVMNDVRRLYFNLDYAIGGTKMAKIFER